jgi:membrane protein DedA with SNARE-associated domain
VLGLGIAGEAVGSEWKSVRKGFDYVDYAIVVLVVIAIVYAIIRRRRGPSDTVDPAADAAG